MRTLADQGFSGEVRFRPVEDGEGRYSHLQAVLKRFVYPQLKRVDKGLVLRYLGRTTGYSRQHLTRLVRQCLATGGLHRPCLFAEDTIDDKGKVKKRYPQRLVMTPLEKLASLPDPDTFLKPGITLAQLQDEATRLTDNDAAQQLNEARQRLFQSIHHRSKCAA